MNKFEEMRRKAGLSIALASEIAGVNQSTISYIERGARNPRLDTMEKLARAYNVEVSDFF